MMSYFRCVIFGILLFATSGAANGLIHDKFLENCEEQGHIAGNFGVAGACAIVLNKCPPPVVKIVSKGGPLIPDLVGVAVNKTCNTLFTEACKASALATATLTPDFPVCSDILTFGPGPGAPLCSSLADAASIFERAMGAICDIDVSTVPARPAPPTVPEELPLSTGKPTFQSSTARGGFDFLAVDGNRNGNYDAGSCTFTGVGKKLKTQDPWWTVDLGKSFNVTRVAITNRSDCCGRRLRDFSILVGDERPTNNGKPLSNKACGSKLNVPQGETVTFDCPAKGRYVSVQIFGRRILTLCEVEVFGVQGN